MASISIHSCHSAILCAVTSNWDHQRLWVAILLTQIIDEVPLSAIAHRFNIDNDQLSAIAHFFERLKSHLNRNDSKCVGPIRNSLRWRWPIQICDCECHCHQCTQPQKRKHECGIRIQIHHSIGVTNRYAKQSCRSGRRRRHTNHKPVIIQFKLNSAFCTLNL